MRRRVSSAGGFVGGITVLLALLIAVLLAWKTFVQISHVPKVMLGADRYTSKYISTNVGVGITFIALAGGVGAAAYFAARKSERAAAVGMNTVLGLGVAVFSYQLYRYYALGPASVTAGPSVAQQPAPARPSPIPSPGPASVPTPGPSARPTQPANPAPNTAPPAPVTPTPVKPAPAPTPPAPNAAIEPIVSRRRDEVRAECAKLAEAAGAAMDFASKPKKSGTELDSKITTMQELSTGAEALEKRLRGESDALQTELEGAGVESGEAMRAAMEFVRAESIFERGNAASAVGRFATDATEFCRVMRENLPRIQISPAGEVTSKDREVEQKLFSPRAQVKFQLSDRERTLGALR